MREQAAQSGRARLYMRLLQRSVVTVIEVLDSDWAFKRDSVGHLV